MFRTYPSLRLLSAEGIIGLLAVIVATAAELDWVFRSIMVAAGLALWGHLIFRSDRHIVVRVSLFVMGAVAFLAVTWHPIWEDFHTKHPEIAADTYLRILADKGTLAADFVRRPRILWPLAAIALVILIWRARPVWSVQYRVFAFWRRALSIEGVWLERGAALDAIRASQWAQLRAPGRTISEILTRSLFSSPESLALQASQVKFNLFLEMTLDAFETSNPNYIRTTGGKKEYLEEKLLQRFFRKRTA